MQRKPFLASAIETVPVDELLPHARNPRTHTPEQVAQIASSIQEFGFVAPILVDENNTIIAGHGRLLAARRLRMAAVPVVRISHLSEAQKKALLIADNRIALNAGWDEQQLRTLVEELREEQLQGILGFEPEELEKLVGATEDNAQDADDDFLPPERKITVTLRFSAEIWLGCREQILQLLEKLEKRFNCAMEIDE